MMSALTYVHITCDLKYVGIYRYEPRPLFSELNSVRVSARIPAINVCNGYFARSYQSGGPVEINGLIDVMLGTEPYIARRLL